jgi:hypothetical protein
MKIRSTNFWFAICGVLFSNSVSVVSGQGFRSSEEAARVMQLELNTARLKITITTDRPEYLTGEAVEATVTITNPTTSALEVFEPFRKGTGSFYVAIQPGTETKTQFRPNDEKLGHRSRAAAPTKWFSAGETVTRTVSSFDNHFEMTSLPMIDLPTLPGEFLLMYTYAYTYAIAGTAKFRVLPTVLVAPVFVPLQAPGQSKNEDGPVRYKRNVPLLILQAQGRYYLLVSRNSERGSFVARTPDGGYMEDAMSFSPLVRIAESDLPFVSLNGIELAPGTKTAAGTPLPPESIRVDWTTADGKQFTATLGPDRRPVP